MGRSLYFRHRAPDENSVTPPLTRENSMAVTIRRDCADTFYLAVGAGSFRTSLRGEVAWALWAALDAALHHNGTQPPAWLNPRITPQSS